MMRLLLLILLPLLPSGRAAAQTVSFKLTPSIAKPRLAEPFTLRFQLTYPADYTVRPDTSAFLNDVFELLKIKEASSSTAGAVKTDTFELEAAAFDIGVSTFPETAWLLTKGSELKEAKSPAFQLEILPAFDAKAGAPAEIRDIRPPFKFVPWTALLACLLAAALASWFLYRRYKAMVTSANAGSGNEPDTRTPYQKASDSLAELAASNLWAESRIKEFYSRLSDIFRSYLDEQFAIKAELLTTNGITRELRRTGAEIKTVVKARELLENSDLVKFAKFKPGETERDASVASLKDLLLSFDRSKEANRVPPVKTEGVKP
jgi:hypothetical protein